MQKLLVAVDGSDYSINALETAIKLAKTGPSTITLLTVFNMDAMGLSTNTIAYNNTLEKNTDKLRDYLDELVEKYSSDEYNLEKLIRIGNVSNEITEEADKHDMLFIGSRGLGRVERAFLGSVSGKVVNSTDVPTMVVKGETNFDKILIPIDGSRYAKRALIRANEIGKSFGSELILLNVMDNIHVPQMQSFDMEVAANISDEARQDSNQVLGQGKEYIKGYPHQLRTLSVEGDASSTILQVSKEEDIDLIVMGSKGLGAFSRALLGSVSHEVLNKSKASVLINH